jgi:hypothetical protein
MLNNIIASVDYVVLKVFLWKNNRLNLDVIPFMIMKVSHTVCAKNFHHQKWILRQWTKNNAIKQSYETTICEKGQTL